MKTKRLDPDELNLVSLAKEYSNENKARALLEKMRWPNGPVCPHCKNAGEKAIYKLNANEASKRSVRAGVYKCGACRRQFTVTLGTVFEGSHIPISKWMMAMFILCSSKKAVSAHQLHRMLGITYKSAWFMAHRIRFAMSADSPDAKLLSGVVEADETFIGGKGDGRTKYMRQTPVVALIERGGNMRTRVISNVTQKNIGQCVRECVSKDATLNTDEHPAYKPVGKEYKLHSAVNHSKMEYSRRNKDGTVSNVNSCESFFSLLKRGVVGSWHHISREHLAKYAGEFSFRWNHRKVSDGERMLEGIRTIAGKRLTYHQAT